MSECFLYTCDVSSDFVLQCRVVCVAITGIPTKAKPDRPWRPDPCVPLCGTLHSLRARGCTLVFSRLPRGTVVSQQFRSQFTHYFPIFLLAPFQLTFLCEFLRFIHLLYTNQATHLRLQ